ncbi:hypothetical protein ABLI39_12755 [Pseudarthrobacter sp. B907]|uniref:hypothetical protein n=1 Tax=Pseudarthrobacter sp. B907 TaxID=3158261 RepID=UPI0032DBB4B8
MFGIHAGGQRLRVGVERQAPLAQECNAEGDEEDAAHPACQQRPVPPADDDLGHTRHVGHGAGGQEPQSHGFVKGGAGEYQQGQRRQRGSDGSFAAFTHVAHVTNHP